MQKDKKEKRKYWWLRVKGRSFSNLGRNEVRALQRDIIPSHFHDPSQLCDLKTGHNAKLEPSSTTKKEKVNERYKNE